MKKIIILIACTILTQGLKMVSAHAMSEGGSNCVSDFEGHCIDFGSSSSSGGGEGSGSVGGPGPNTPMLAPIFARSGSDEDRFDIDPNVSRNYEPNSLPPVDLGDLTNFGNIQVAAIGTPVMFSAANLAVGVNALTSVQGTIAAINQALNNPNISAAVRTQLLGILTQLNTYRTSVAISTGTIATIASLLNQAQAVLNLAGMGLRMTTIAGVASIELLSTLGGVGVAALAGYAAGTAIYNNSDWIQNGGLDDVFAGIDFLFSGYAPINDFIPMW